MALVTCILGYILYVEIKLEGITFIIFYCIYLIYLFIVFEMCMGKKILQNRILNNTKYKGFFLIKYKK